MVSPPLSITLTGRELMLTAVMLAGVTLLQELYKSGKYGPAVKFVCAGTAHTLASVEVIVPTDEILEPAQPDNKLDVVVTAVPCVTEPDPT